MLKFTKLKLGEESEQKSKGLVVTLCVQHSAALLGKQQGIFYCKAPEALPLSSRHSSPIFLTVLSVHILTGSFPVNTPRSSAPPPHRVTEPSCRKMSIGKVFKPHPAAPKCHGQLSHAGAVPRTQRVLLVAVRPREPHQEPLASSAAEEPPPLSNPSGTQAGTRQKRLEWLGEDTEGKPTRGQAMGKHLEASSDKPGQPGQAAQSCTRELHPQARSGAPWSAPAAAGGVNCTSEVLPLNLHLSLPRRAHKLPGSPTSAQEFKDRSQEARKRGKV